jgi:hypothetical protein
VSWEDPPTDEQEKRIGQFARILGQDVEQYYPIANRREARQIMYELMSQIKSRNVRRAAERISRKLTGGN